MPGRITTYAQSITYLRRFLDQMPTAASWHLGIVRDVVRHAIPDGGCYDAVDFFLHEPGKAWKRGGWERHSAALGASGRVTSVATIHVPCRVVATGDDGNLYNVTSENVHQADVIGSCWAPRENPPYFVNRLIFCDPDGEAVPKKVFYNIHTDAMEVFDLGGDGCPAAVHSCAHIDRIVLARGAPETGHLNRIWFSPSEIPVDASDSEGTWDPESWLDVSHEITGLASVSASLLVFTPHQILRVTGSIPPHTIIDSATDTPFDMAVDVLAEVGCTDGRSIVEYDENVIYAGTDGVYLCNGAGIQDLTRKTDGTGIQRLWQELFPLHPFDSTKPKRQLIGGLLKREFYLLTILDENDNWLTTLCCHMPSQTWTKLSNIRAMMFAAGSDEQDLPDLYMASRSEPYVERLAPILRPTDTNTLDGDDVEVIPFLELRPLGQDAGIGLKAFGFGWVSYLLVDPEAFASLQIQISPGIQALTFTDWASFESSLEMRHQRFHVYKDTNAINVRIYQNGPSAQTELYSLELEARAYSPQSDYLHSA